ncbi:hypothetical protein [Teredinibacter turnerae]|uniref:hypothetical protein n=1 Tax=Teredinibacter turnerae TaxID=2426 RepID=UPI0030CD4B38
MTDKKQDRPPVDSPEFKEWLKKRAKKRMDSIFGDDYKPAEFDERGAIFGKVENLDKTDAELFPGEIEEYTPEERRNLMKVHNTSITAISFPSEIKTELMSIAQNSGYSQVLEILSRGTEDELVLNGIEEAQAVADVAQIKLLDTQLKFPYWDSSRDNYNQAHENVFRNVQMGVFEITVSYIGQEFDIRLSTYNKR